MASLMYTDARCSRNFSASSELAIQNVESSLREKNQKRLKSRSTLICNGFAIRTRGKLQLTQSEQRYVFENPPQETAMKTRKPVMS